MRAIFPLLACFVLPLVVPSAEAAVVWRCDPLEVIGNDDLMQLCKEVNDKVNPIGEKVECLVPPDVNAPCGQAVPPLPLPAPGKEGP